ncbi:MAG: 30S ribosomal protein S12 methylthiotransferase RimO [Brevinematia bacterium]
MKVFIDTLGCPKALVDAERLCYFIEKKHSLVSTPEDADVIVINTCGFIDKAKKENINTILSYTELKKKNPSLKIIVSGCLSERYKNELFEAIPEIDAATGVRDFSKIADAILKKDKQNLLDEGEFKDINFTLERNLYFSGLHYAYIKISEGCNRLCSFCTIPMIRGKQRSRKIKDIIKEAEMLKENGIEELILISEDSISYGIDLYGKKMLKDLIKSLSALDFSWIRIMYLFPDDYIYEVVETMSSLNNVCKYLDIPLQHVSKRILASMNRNGGYKEYLEMINRLRKINPEVSLRSSFIIGYPGETEKEFEELKNFLKEANINRAGFFEYSDEEGTLSYKITPKVKKSVIKSRLRELIKIQEEISKNNLKKYIGKKLKCIFDGSLSQKGKEVLIFRTEYDAPEIDGVVKVSYHKRSDLNYEEAYREIKIVDSDSTDLYGVFV